MSIDFDKIREHCKEHGHCTWSDAYALITEVERLRNVLTFIALDVRCNDLATATFVAKEAIKNEKTDVSQ